MITTTMDRNERLERGEKFLVFAIMCVFGIESLFTIVSGAMRFSWLGLVWGGGSALFLLFLANSLYAGNRTAQKLASVWSAFQIILSLVILLVLAFNPQAGSATAHLALPIWWMAAVKLAGYGIMALALFLAPRVRDFLDVQRGADIAPENPLSPTGVEVTFADDQKQVIRSLGTLLKAAGAVLVVVGVLQSLVALREFIQIAQVARADAIQSLALWLFIRFLPAVATVAIGILMIPPAAAARLISTQGTDMSYIMNALMKLRAFFLCLAGLVGIQVVGALLGLPMF